MTRKAWLFVGMTFLALLGLGLLAHLSFITVRKRITWIDLRAIYPNLQDNSEGRIGYVIGALEYPDQSGTAYFHLKASQGSISLECSLDDFDRRFDSRKKWKIGDTSQPFGQDVFFKNETDSQETLELVYRRHNLNVCFRNSPLVEYHDGRPVLTIGTNKMELERTARVLDDAIAQNSPCIKIEDVKVYQVVRHEVRNYVGGMLWIVCNPVVMLAWLGILTSVSILVATCGRRRWWGLVLALLPTVAGGMALSLLLSSKDAPAVFYASAAFPLLFGVGSLVLWTRRRIV